MRRTVEVPGKREQITIELGEPEDLGKGPRGDYAVFSASGARVAHGRYRTRDGRGYCLTLIPFDFVSDAFRETVIATVDAMLA